jgi:hypothetical protein
MLSTRTALQTPTVKQKMDGRKREEQRDSQESTPKRKVDTANMVGGAALEWHG